MLVLVTVKPEYNTKVLYSVLVDIGVISWLPVGVALCDHFSVQYSSLSCKLCIREFIVTLPGRAVEWKTVSKRQSRSFYCQ